MKLSTNWQLPSSLYMIFHPCLVRMACLDVFKSRNSIPHFNLGRSISLPLPHHPMNTFVMVPSSPPKSINYPLDVTNNINRNKENTLHIRINRLWYRLYHNFLTRFSQRPIQEFIFLNILSLI